ncbi:hypothetical protein DV738_g4212, partial [Chaetothyriales sp. CBS 135597]
MTIESDSEGAIDPGAIIGGSHGHRIATKIRAATLAYLWKFSDDPVQLQIEFHRLKDDPKLQAAQTAARRFNNLIKYNTTAESVDKIPSDRLRLTLKTKNADGTDTWYEEEFDFLIVAPGHNSRILVVGTSESAIDVTLQSLPYTKSPIYVSQRTHHPRFPTVFLRKGVEVPPTIERIEGDAINLSGGQVLKSIDTIVFATGYFYTYPFLKHIRPAVQGGKRVPGLYQHVFDMHNPNIAFIGVVNGSLSWLTWEKSAFLAALLWSGRIKLPPIEEQRKWEARRVAETSPNDKMFHILAKPSERVIYFDELNELAADYLHTDAPDDELLRSFPWDWIVSLGTGGARKAQYYGIEV